MYTAMFIIAAFLLLSIYLGIKATKGKDMSMEEWAVGGRGFGTIFVFLLMAGESYSTFTLLGASGWAYAKGGAVYYILAYTALAYMISYWLLPPIWRYAAKHKLVSQSDFFASKYKSPILGVLVSIVGVLAMIPYLVIQLKGLGIIVSETSYGAISPTLAIWIGMIALTGYVMISGVHGSAWTAVIKDILVFFVVLFVGIYLPFHYHGGIQPMFEALNAQMPSHAIFAEKGFSITWFVSTVILQTAGLYMWPYCFASAFTAKNATILRKNAIMMPLYTLMLLFVFFIGYTAILQVPGLKGAESDLALLRLSTKTFDPWFVGIIGAVGLLSALVLGSLLLMNSATILARNIYPLFVKNADEHQVERMAKLFIPLISIICLYYALGDSSSLNILFLTGYSLVTQLFPALLASLFKNNFITKQGAFVGIALGEAIVIYTTATNTTMATLFPAMPSFIQDINVGVIALLFNIVSMMVVSALTRSGTKGKEQEREQKQAL
ncbi:MAG TPA: sodium:solute symporter [Bacillus sp. (in: firmicutes)]|nr:sodium:solute symporter [Bacillus sp. (in: firmicutes)]